MLNKLLKMQQAYGQLTYAYHHQKTTADKRLKILIATNLMIDITNCNLMHR